MLPDEEQIQYIINRISELERRIAVLEGKEHTDEQKEVYTETSEHTFLKAVKEVSKETSRPSENLGFKIFGSIGFIFILLGLFYLYRYAVEQGWIGILERVVLGIMFSLAVLIAGEVFRRKEYLRFSQLITGGGIALLYFTIYSTYHFKEFREALDMSLGMNTVLLFFVMACAVFLALRENSLILTGFAFFLGYLAALLTGEAHQMMISTLLLSVGLTVILWKRNWGIGIYPVIVSYLLYTIFFFNSRIIFSPDAIISPIVYYAIGYLICFFTLFTVLSILLKDEEDYIQNVVIMLINAFAAFVFGLSIVWEYWHSARGVFVILMSAMYLGMAYYSGQRKRKNMFRIFFVLCITFLTIAIPIQLEGSWVAFAWAIEGILLVQAGVRIENWQIRRLGYIVLGLAAIRSLLFDVHGLPFWERATSMVVVILALYGVQYLISKAKLRDDEKNLPTLFNIAGTFLLTISLAVEILDSEGLLAAFSGDVRIVILSVVWAVEAVVLIVVGFVNRSSSLRYLGLLLFGITVMKILIVDLSFIETIYRTIVTIIVGLIALGASFAYVKNKERIEELLK